jgi:hypothetical protein
MTVDGGSSGRGDFWTAALFFVSGSATPNALCARYEVGSGTLLQQTRYLYMGLIFSGT